MKSIAVLILLAIVLCILIVVIRIVTCYHVTMYVG